MTQPPAIKLSICIPTFNRATFIGQALQSIISQATKDCEIVVADNASTDGTEQVVSEYARHFDRLRYIRQKENMGFDPNCDCAVEAARGEYCWVFSDDDLMKPDAIATVLAALRQDHSLVLVNGEHRDFTMSNLRVASFFDVSSDRVYSFEEFDRLFMDVGVCVMCLCCVVIRRALWVTRDRQRYYGSWFLHTAVVFQQPIPGTTLVIAKPLMSLRIGNAQTSEAASFQVWFMCWPALVWSFPLAETTKRHFCDPTPWRRFRYLLALRALGVYSRAEYERWLRPSLGGLQEILIPTLVSLLSRRIAEYLYTIGSIASGRPRSPHTEVESMFPKSLRALRPT